MNLFFEPAVLRDGPLAWSYRNRSVANFKGYYHWHQCCEILFVHEGCGSVIVGRQTYEIRSGMLFFFQPFELHKVYADVSAEHPYVRTVIHFDPLEVEQWLRPFPARHSLFNRLWQGNQPERGFDLARCLVFLNEIGAAYEQKRLEGKGGAQEELTLLLLQLMSCIQFAGKDEQTPDMPEEKRRPQRYSEAIMNWLESHYTEEIELDRLAEELHLSKFYVSRVFRQETGSSITDYVTARRIKQACRLLQTTVMPVERIGAEVGLANTSYFIQLFKRVVGVTPLKYRNGG